MLYETTLRTKRTPLCASYICRAYCNNYYCIAARVCLMTRENCRVNRTGVCGFFFVGVLLILPLWSDVV